MALSDAMAAYDDCYEYFDRAIAAEKGIRILVADESAAYHLRLRINKARVLQREESRRIYPPTDPRYGKSENDRFRITMHPTAEGDGGYWVYIEPWAQTISEIEEL